MNTSTVCSKNQCNGCMACVDACPQKAIEIKDELAYYNAFIKEDCCIHCNACHRVCPNNSSVGILEPRNWYQGWARQESVRLRSASGGVASAIASYFVENGGDVCTCVFDHGKFCFKCLESKETLRGISGSRYVKSNPEGIYRIVQQKLKGGKKILFIGLPCQVDALKHFIKADMQDNLYTVDLICHGTPSPRLLEVFLQQYGYSLQTLNDIQFREKTGFQVSSLGKRIAAVAGVNDRYTIGFLQGLFYTDNCYNCPYATLRRVGDIALGDSWGSNLSEDEKQKGISLILIQTKKGKFIIDQANLHKEEVDLGRAVENNPQLKSPVAKPDKREQFFACIRAGKNFNTAVFRCCRKKSIKQEIKKVLIQLKVLGGGKTLYGICIDRKP